MTCFQSPKHVIKSKDPWKVRIEVTIPGFLTGPPPKGTFKVELTVQQDAKIIWAKKEIVPSDEEPEKPVQEPAFTDLEKDFEVFNRPDLAEHSKASSKPQSTAQASINQEVTNKPEGMVIQNRTPDLLALLESHAGGVAPKVAIDPRSPTPPPSSDFSFWARREEKEKGQKSQ